MKGQPRSWRSRLAVLIGATVAASILGSGCFNGAIGEPGTSCQSTRSYFLNEVWGPVMSQTCVSCHAPGGQASIQNAQLVLLPASYPDFADANMASAARMVNVIDRVNGREIPHLLAKPLGLVPHGGNVQLREGTDAYNRMAEFAARVAAGAQNDQACRDYGSLAAPSGVALLDWRQTLRKASLDMLGRLPTDDEYTRASTGEQAFDDTFSAMIRNDQAFYDRWRIAWNDVMLTDRYITDNPCDQRALNMISGNDFPNRGTYGGGGMGSCCDGNDANRAHYNSQECVDQRNLMLSANNAVAQEPVNLFEYVVRNDRPFSEILTADYTLVNSASARIYGVDSQYPMGYGSEQLAPARITYTRQYDRNMGSETVEFPHAGVLTTPAFISRYPTTDTNRNRHRARIVQAYFLATDILKVGERPLDPAASEAQIQTPTMNYGPCRTCHSINDPIAGAFRGFYPSDNTQWRFDPRDPWYTDMFPPGFNGESMPGSEYRSALRWLAPRITQDPRFVSSVVRFVYTALTARQPLVYPTGDPTMDPTYAQRAAAWVEQDRIFRAIGRRFIATNMNFRTVVVEMVKSPLYRASQVVFPPNLPADQLATRMNEHMGIGTATLLTPEQLDRRIRAIAGFGWLRDMRANDMRNPSSIQREQASRDAHGGNLAMADNQGLLLNDYYFPYGGIDSDTIVTRVHDPSGIILGVAERMANEVACLGTSFDFTQDQASRHFFRNVQLDTVPEAGGAPVPANIANIRANIAALHNLILGENLAADDPEVNRTFNDVFLPTWRETRTAGMGGGVSNDLPCDATFNPATGEALPMAAQIHDDPNGTIRAWQAVLSYLFQDYRFLYQ